MDRPAEEGARGRQFVNALARGLQVLAAFEPEDRTLGNQEIAERTGLPKPTVSRLTYTLTELGYLVLHRRLGRYSLAPAVLELGHAALAGSGIADHARPVMEELARLDHVAIALGVQSRTRVRYIDLVRRPEAVVLSLAPGSTLPILRSAMGRACLAAMAEDPRARLISELARIDPEEVEATRDALAREIARFREHGYTTSLGEWRPEIHAIATAMDPTGAGRPLLINMGGLAATLTRERIATEFAPALIAGARRIEAQMRAAHSG